MSPGQSHRGDNLTVSLSTQVYIFSYYYRNLNSPFQAHSSWERVNKGMQEKKKRGVRQNRLKSEPHYDH